MSKRQFVFHWYDSPRHVGTVSRAEMAALFRSYRSRPKLYRLYRLQPGIYHVSLRGVREIGVFAATEPVNLVSGKEAANV